MSGRGIDVGGWLSTSGTEKPGPCGAFITPGQGDAQSGVPVPLRRRDVAATIYTNGYFADTKESFSYISDIDCCAVFRFPLPPRSAVYRFCAVVGDREIVTKVKPRDEAREEYELAVLQGHSAVHLSQHEEGASVFEISLGNLEAHTEFVVEVRYLRLLDSLGSTLEWVHTATWVPPYIGSEGDVKAGLNKVAAALPVFANKVSYSLSYELKILTLPGAVCSIESPQPVTVVPPAEDQCHGLAESKGAAGGCGPMGQQGCSGGGSCCWNVSLSSEVADPSRDLTLMIEMVPTVAGQSNLLVHRLPPPKASAATIDTAEGEVGETRTFVLATFVPPIPTAPTAAPTTTAVAAATEAAAVAPLPLQQQQPLEKELWFVVDCSGSMQGEPIRQARESALLFVRDMPLDAGVKFNVTCFGSSHESLYNKCMPYDAITEKAAVSWIQQHVQADMGGTEIFNVLESVYRSPVSPGYSREIIFLTDGGISGHEETLVYELITPKMTATTNGPADADLAEAARRTHVLCLGIGEGVHRSLLDGISRRSSGLAVYVVSDEAIGAKTAFLKKAATAYGSAMQPRLVTHGSLVRPAPHLLPQRIFAGEPLHVLLEVVQCESDASLELVADYCERPQAAGRKVEQPPPQLRLSLPLGPAVREAATAAGGRRDGGEALGVLHAMSYIDSLMAGTSPLHVRPDGTTLPEPSADLVRQTVVRLAIAANLVTPYTSAVGVSLRRDPADPSAASRLVEVPLQVPRSRTLWKNSHPMNHFGAVPMNLFRVVSRSAVRGRPRCLAATPASAVYTSAMAVPPPRSGAPANPVTNPMERCQPHPAPPPASPPSMWSKLSAFLKVSSSHPSGLSSTTCAPGALMKRRGVPGAAAKTASAGAPKPWLKGTVVERELEVEAMPLPAPSPSFQELEAEEPCAPCVAGAATTAAAATATATTGFPDDDDDDDAASASPAGPLVGSELLAFLNLNRTTAGYWRASPSLACVLGVPPELLQSGEAYQSQPQPQQQEDMMSRGQDATEAAAVAGAAAAASECCPHPAAALRPAGLSDDEWATLLVLAVLRRSLWEQREVWAEMQAKAVAWLQARRSQEAAATPAAAAGTLGEGPGAVMRSVGGAVLALARVL